MKKPTLLASFLPGWRRALFTLVFAAGLAACTQSIRPEAIKVAAAGSTTAGEMEAYYDTLAQDTVGVWEMTAFDRGFTGLPETEVTSSLQEAYKDRYLALLNRKRFASTIAATYKQFSNLASYDSSADVLASLGKLQKEVEGLKASPLPPIGNVGVSATSAINALATELQTAAENRAILKQSERLVTLIQKVKAVFDTELPVYRSIADDKKRVYTKVAQALVKGKAVDSTALVNRVLESYELKWPTPTQPFVDQNLIGAVVEVINARATPISQISQDAGEKLSGALGELVSLHKNLVAKKPLSFEEIGKQNAVVQGLLDALKKRTSIDVSKIIGVVEAK